MHAATTVNKIGPYHYVPTEWICALFVALYSISTLLHFCQSIKYRLWWLFPTAVFAGVMEILGWSARLWSSKSPHLLIPYEIQLVGTILAPTPLVAANFIILGKIIGRLGTRYSRLTPKWYTIIFCSFDVACLVVQAVGGAQAAFAVNKGQNPDNGGNIMLGGIVAQMVSIAVYVACAGEFFLRFFSDSPLRKVDKSTSMEKERDGEVVDRKMKFMIMGLLFDTTCIFIRSVYRTIELANGFAGPIISTQVYFNVLDGAMVTLAIFTLNFTHPGALLYPSRPTTSMSVSGGAEEEGRGERTS
ncbi:RTA1-domain-containing protein [Leucogyrophana mollusca]|uniref:RTA1-domain-containing protein n=1 Tax=Leucogyrophana mollusca TaxID=85980 RepID=A0ACB8BH97_9AGAM|nr:RTA1-domain-containing protein [Leucogyrophana mollusca]